ncbi:MAG: hypothetical protein ABSA97_08305 [Verrucomicrobiia bacterium]
MDWIKKHYEKITLALALLLLIASATILSLKVGALSQEIQEAPRRTKTKGKPAQSINLGPYTNAIESVQQPPLWTNKPMPMFIGPVPISVTSTAQAPAAEGKLPVLAQVLYVPFNLLFMAYSGDGHNFQLNFLTRSQTFMVPEVGMEVADRFSKTGYIIKKFEKKTITVTEGGITKDKDVSELTLQHEGDDPIVMVHGRIKAGREPVAQILCGGSTLYVRRGQPFSCVDTTYNVVDITPKQMIIIDVKSGEKQIIPLSVPK